MSKAHGGADRGEVVAYLSSLLLEPEDEDYCPNGLQVEGRPEIRRLVTGVSACLELFERARERRADAILVHHGLFWRGDPREIVGLQYRRMRELVRGELNLLAYHLPLDRHPVLGNNAVAARELGLDRPEPFGLGFKGRFEAPISPLELVRRCAHLYAQDPVAFLAGPSEIRSLGIVSGAAQRDVHRAIAEGLDAFLTGEATEWVMNVARESGIHYLACGHYATERLGVKALGEHLAQRFGIEVEFIDIPNPV